MKEFEWNRWPKEKPTVDGQYLVMIGSIDDSRKWLISAKNYTDKKWNDLELNSETIQFFWAQTKKPC